ncbi:MAG: YheO-like PAS domain protein, partial [Clostridia bacterium]|nr:YheO-like PAS domain protein [Clostridia bacterium]
STFYIKNKGKLVGMLCINNDMTPVNDFKASVQTLLSGLQVGKEEGPETEYSETLANPLTSLANSIIGKTIANFNVAPTRMSSEEKQRIVQQLNDQGVLLLKGAVAEIAQQLRISEGTVYRYINKK